MGVVGIMIFFFYGVLIRKIEGRGVCEWVFFGGEYVWKFVYFLDSFFIGSKIII